MSQTQKETNAKKIGPNEEQLKAIEHNGGVLLSAGAGSGKTFVLVEHMVYLTRQWLEKLQGLNDEEFIFQLKKEFSSLVVMTFTTKATGELKIRLKKRFIREKDEYPKEKWGLVIEAIEELNISTIHGHCLRLISQGFFPKIPSELELVDESSYAEKISTLFEIWFERHSEKFFEQLPWMKDIIYANQKQLKTALVKVFSTPELRDYWGRASLDEICSKPLKEFIDEYLSLSDMASYDQFSRFDLAPYSEHKTKAWYKILEGFLHCAQTSDLWSEKGLETFQDFFQGIKRLTGPQAKSGLLEVIEQFESIKFIRTLVQDYGDDLRAYIRHRDDLFRGQAQTFKSIISFIEDQYFLIPGSTFADLEYYVLKGLEDVESAKRVQDHYKYFIIDEFQDTSYIQFEILRRSIGEDFSRVFCVGDVKQAIYGFRGGELGVFHECEQKVEKNLELNNNYRSTSRVVHFNNFFFDHLFKMGLKFEGVDHHTVPVSYQKSPTLEDEGELFHLKAILNGLDSRAKPAELNEFEAKVLYQHILDLRESYPNDEICILYKNLRPSQYLTSLLMDNDIGFSAQVKVPYSEEPLIGLAMLLVEDLLDFKSLKKIAPPKGRLLLYDAYMSYLNISVKNLEEKIHDFYLKMGTLAFIEAYQIFLQRLGVVNSNHEKNLKELNSMYAQSCGDIEKFHRLIKQRCGQDFSIQFSFGESSEKITLMTAHASKGLEFDHVLVGGVHTNGTSFPETDYFGKMPGSFKWKLSDSQKRPYKSPAYLIEELLEKKKTFAESKRLFYVAATRSIKTFSWADLSSEKTDLQHDKNSWINGLRQVFNKVIDGEALQVFKRIKIKNYQFDVVDESTLEESALVADPPLFHKDTLGIIEGDAPDTIGVSGEISVTGLSVLSLCHRRFYLSQVCKIDSKLFQSNSNEENHIQTPDNDDEINYQPSSAQRGTLIHEVLSQSIKHNGVIPLKYSKEMSQDDARSVKWALDQLEMTKNSDYIYESEVPLKFSFFGFMVSGTPDLVIKNDEELKIIDFKTGKRKLESQENYWSQLMAYAYAVCDYRPEYKSKTIKLCLYYVDQQREDEKLFSYSDLEDELYKLWKKTAHLDQVNREHCSDCPFGNLCLS